MSAKTGFGTEYVSQAERTSMRLLIGKGVAPSQAQVLALLDELDRLEAEAAAESEAKAEAKAERVPCATYGCPCCNPPEPCKTCGCHFGHLTWCVP
jgi:hypothetical protein